MKRLLTIMKVLLHVLVPAVICLRLDFKGLSATEEGHHRIPSSSEAGVLSSSPWIWTQRSADDDAISKNLLRMDVDTETSTFSSSHRQWTDDAVDNVVEKSLQVMVEDWNAGIKAGSERTVVYPGSLVSRSDDLGDLTESVGKGYRQLRNNTDYARVVPFDVQQQFEKNLRQLRNKTGFARKHEKYNLSGYYPSVKRDHPSKSVLGHVAKTYHADLKEKPHFPIKNRQLVKRGELPFRKYFFPSAAVVVRYVSGNSSSSSSSSSSSPASISSGIPSNYRIKTINKTRHLTPLGASQSGRISTGGVKSQPFLPASIRFSLDSREISPDHSLSKRETSMSSHIWDHGFRDDRQNMTVVEAQVGRSATINCYTKYRGPDLVVSWLRRDLGYIITVGHNIFSRIGRYELGHDLEEGLWQLTITNIKDSDEGMYECQLATDKPVSLFFNLTVKESKAIIKGRSEVTVQEGHRLTLNCTVVDALEPPRYIMWLLDGSVVPHMTARTTKYSKTLHVSHVGKEHSGIYSCDPYLAVPAYVRVNVVSGGLGPSRGLPGASSGNDILDTSIFGDLDMESDQEPMVEWPEVFSPTSSSGSLTFGEASSFSFPWIVVLALSAR